MINNKLYNALASVFDSERLYNGQVPEELPDEPFCAYAIEDDVQGLSSMSGTSDEGAEFSIACFSTSQLQATTLSMSCISEIREAFGRVNLSINKGATTFDKEFERWIAEIEVNYSVL